MATVTSPNQPNSAVSKTQLLRDLYSDVQQLKQNIEPAVQASAWIKEQFKPTMKKMKDMLDAEIQSIRTDVASTDAYAKNITQWIKDTLGTKLEKVSEMLADTVTKQLEKQAEEAKLREESLWSIFNTKFDTYTKQVEEDRLHAGAQIQWMAEEMKRIHTLRVQIEQSHGAMKQTQELVLKESRERPEQEMQMFRKLTKKLEEERKKIEEARQQMEEERKKMEEERAKFDKMLEEERKRLQDRQILDYERKKLEDERRLLLAAQQQTLLASPGLPVTQQILQNTPAPVSQLSAPSPVVSAAPPSMAELSQWLKREGFEQYAATFAQFGYHSMAVVALLDDEDLSIMGITLPGHRKGLLAAATKLRDAGNSALFAPNSPTEVPSSPEASQTSSVTISEPKPSESTSSSLDSSASSPQPKPAARKLPIRPLPKTPQ